MKRVSIALFGILLALAVAPMCAFANEGDNVAPEEGATDAALVPNQEASEGDEQGNSNLGNPGAEQGDPANSDEENVDIPSEATNLAGTPEAALTSETPETPDASEVPEAPDAAQSQGASKAANAEGPANANTPAALPLAHEAAPASVPAAATVASVPAEEKTPAKATAATTAKKATTQAPATQSKKAPAAKDSLATLINNAVYRISTALAAKDTKVLDVSGGSTKNGANVQIFEANDTLSQYWRAEYQGNGIYHLVSYNGGHLLGISGKPVSQANVVNIDKSNINWRITKNSDGTYSLAPANATSLRLDVKLGKPTNGTNVWVYSSNGTKAQKFHFVEQAGLTEAWALGKTATPGVVEIALQGDETLRVDIANESSSSGANVQLEKDSKAMSQKFQMRYIGNGLYEFQNAISGKCLDVSRGSKKAGANVQQFDKNETIAQYWYLKKTGSGYQIKSAGSGLALDTKDSKANAGANVQMAKASNAATQKYNLKSVALIENGTYVIQSALIAPMVLDVADGSSANGANLQLWRSNGTNAQKFKITHLGNGLYSIVGVGSGKYVDVAGGSTKSGGNVWMYEGNNTEAQKWYIEVDSKGLMFKSAKSGKYLDVNKGRVNKGTNIQQYNGNKTMAQHFILHDENWTYYPKNTNLNDLKIIVKAEEYDGWPYRWGGRRPSTSFDCAGLVMYCSNQVWGTNFDLMMTNAERLYSLCKPVAEKDAKVGDLVFYRGTYGSNVNYISHVVIYAGKGIMYGAGDPIGYAKVDSIRNIRKQKAVYMYARIRH